jgi:adenylate cyclase
VLEGSVRKAGDRVRVTAQLMETDSELHLWSETYDRQLVDIFAVQDEIARAIAGELQLTKDRGASLATALTDNLEAYPVALSGRLSSNAVTSR